MSLFFAHWSFDPFLVVIAAVALLHEIGVRRLMARSRGARTKLHRRHSLAFYGGLVTLAVAIASPIDYWSDYYLFVHMIQHLLLVFAAPALLVVSAPVAALEHGLPLSTRRALVRPLRTGAAFRPLRRAAEFAGKPVVAVVALNVTVVGWHLPALLDLAEENPIIHIVAMHGSFFLVGVLFFRQLVGSRRAMAPPGFQIAAIFSTAIVFWVFAMAMALFARGPWYSWYEVHEGPLLSPFADQQIAAGIMWICGDFWATPTMIRAVRRLIEDPGGGRLPIYGRIHAAIAAAESAEHRALRDATRAVESNGSAKKLAG